MIEFRDLEKVNIQVRLVQEYGATAQLGSKILLLRGKRTSGPSRPIGDKVGHFFQTNTGLFALTD